MSKIRSADTKIEIRVRHRLYHNGIRYRKNYTELPGKPDIAITKYKIGIFVDGCFWHGHDNCKFFIFQNRGPIIGKTKLKRIKSEIWKRN